MPNVRTTIFLSEEVNRNLECLSLTRGATKTALVREALENFLIDNHLNPFEVPEIRVTYRRNRRAREGQG